jgi:hypothetical protein
MSLLEAISPTAREIIGMSPDGRHRLGLSDDESGNRRTERRDNPTLSQVSCRECGNLTTRAKWKGKGWVRLESEWSDGRCQVTFLCRACAGRKTL